MYEFERLTEKSLTSRSSSDPQNEHDGLNLSEGESELSPFCPQYEAELKEEISRQPQRSKLIPRRKQLKERREQDDEEEEDEYEDEEEEEIVLTGSKNEPLPPEPPLPLLKADQDEQESLPFKYKQMRKLNGKIKLRKRLYQYLRLILGQSQPLQLKEIVEMLRRNMTIRWQQQQLTLDSVHRFIVHYPELRELYQRMAAKHPEPTAAEPPAVPEIKHFCKRAIQLMAHRQNNEVYFLWQSEFPIDLLPNAQGAKSEPARLTFRGVIGTNYTAYWDLIDFDQPQLEIAQSMRFILETILKKSRRFIRLYQENIRFAFEAGFDLIAIPPRAHSVNPNWHWLKELRDHARKFGLRSEKEVRWFLQHEHDRLVPKQRLAEFVYKARGFMVSEIKTGTIELGFTQSLKGYRTAATSQ